MTIGISLLYLKEGSTELALELEAAGGSCSV